mgnify:CR=1 FL=1
MDRQQLLQEIAHKEKNGIFVVTAPTAISANKIVAKVLENYCDSKTALFLSGGSTPVKLYKEITAEKSLKIGAALMVDERFGEKLHKKSNELMIKNTGLLKYFESRNVRFYPIIVEEESLENTALQYDEALRFLLKYFPKTVGLLGLGEDGHTAGLPSGNQKSNLKNQNLIDTNKRILEDQSSLVTFYNEEDGKYGARITMTYLALSQLDLILILVLGQEKREALKLMFAARSTSSGQEGSIEEIPSRFYLQPKIAAKTILITDQIA